jgi:hypothetical protein
MSIAFLDPAHQADNFLSFVEAGIATRGTTPDGRTIYTTRSAQGDASVYLPGVDGTPDITLSEADLPLDQAVDLVLSVQPLTDDAAAKFLKPVSGR